MSDATQVNEHKLSAFAVAPARKSAFEKAKEQAQLKADREAAETAAAYEEFVAEYAPADTTSSAGQQPRSSRAFQPSAEALKRPRELSNPGDDGPLRNRTFAHESSSDEEQNRQWRKLKSSSHFLNELKEKSKNRGHYHSNEHFTKVAGHARAKQQVYGEDRKQSQSSHEQVESSGDDTDSGDDIEHYRSKSTIKSSTKPLNSTNRIRLKFLLDTTTSRRGSVARITAFALTHASSVSEITTTICDNICAPGIDWKTAVARLWCISDILHNSWLPITNVWKYRTQFENRLEAVMKKLSELGESIESRIRKENFRRLVTSVLALWSHWICFGSGSVDRFTEAFEARQDVPEPDTINASTTRTATAWRSLDDSVKQNSQDAVVADLDGEAIDLDGEEIDLDSEPVNLDEDDQSLEVPPDTMASDPEPQRSENTMIAQDRVAARPAVLASMPKIKMSFGKMKLPARAKAADADQMPNVVPVTESEGMTSTIQEPQSVVEATNTTGAPIEDHAGITSQQSGRRQRRSAADFM